MPFDKSWIAKALFSASLCENMHCISTTYIYCVYIIERERQRENISYICLVKKLKLVLLCMKQWDFQNKTVTKLSSKIGCQGSEPKPTSLVSYAVSSLGKSQLVKKIFRNYIKICKSKYKHNIACSENKPNNNNKTPCRSRRRYHLNSFNSAKICASEAQQCVAERGCEMVQSVPWDTPFFSAVVKKT